MRPSQHLATVGYGSGREVGNAVAVWFTPSCRASTAAASHNSSGIGAFPGPRLSPLLETRLYLLDRGRLPIASLAPYPRAEERPYQLPPGRVVPVNCRKLSLCLVGDWA